MLHIARNLPAIRAATPALVSVQRRTFLTGTNFLALTKIVAASITLAGAGFVSWRKYQLSRPRQSALIKSRIETVVFEDVDVPESLKRQVSHTRGVELIFLKNFLRSAPTGPLLILGATGGGQTVLIKEVIGGRHGCIFLDLKRNPISTGEELVHLLCESAGYRFEVSTLMSRFLLREGPRKNRLTSQEAEVALALLSDAFQEQKERGWPLGVPVICLDDIFSIFGDSSFEKDVYFRKFTEWCTHVYDCKLAHVIFVSSHPMSEWELNGIAALKQRRTLVWINFPSAAGVQKYLNQEFDLHKQTDGKPIATPLQIEWIYNCLGGHMEDLDQAITALVRGEAFTTVLQKMITESINFVEGYLEAIIKEAAATQQPEAKAAVQMKYMRFWKMLELLRDRQYVNRRDIANIIFKDHVAELDMYARLELICYLTRGTRPDLGEAKFEKVDLEGAHIETKIENPPVIQEGKEGEDDEKKKVETERERYLLLGEGLGGWIVSAASPRLRMAFDNVLRQPRIIKQRKRVEDSLTLMRNLEKRKELIEEKRELMKERKLYIEELLAFKNGEAVFKNQMGEGVYEKRLNRATVMEYNLQMQLEEIDQNLLLLNTTIKRLEAKNQKYFEQDEN